MSMDDDGNLFFVDRTVDTIKHKGYRVSASEIESTLQEHPAVIASCTVGIPDEKVGERIKAYVVLKEDIKGITGYDLIKWCRETLVSYKVHNYIEFRINILFFCWLLFDCHAQQLKIYCKRIIRFI